MGTTRALKAKIIRQIRALQGDLQAIERVEAIERRHATETGENGDAAERGSTIIGAVEGVLQDDWQTVSAYVDLVKASRSDATRTNVSTALGRLAERGIADSRGDKRAGYEYKRRKEGAP